MPIYPLASELDRYLDSQTIRLGKNRSNVQSYRKYNEVTKCHNSAFLPSKKVKWIHRSEEIAYSPTSNSNQPNLQRKVRDDLWRKLPLFHSGFVAISATSPGFEDLSQRLRELEDYYWQRMWGRHVLRGCEVVKWWSEKARRWEDEKDFSRLSLLSL